MIIKKEEKKTKKNEKLSLFQAQAKQLKLDPTIAKKSHESKDEKPIYVHYSKDNKQRLVIGRGPDATIKIGKGNKKVSREHVVIEYKQELKFFEMTVLSPNGVLVDHIVFMKGEHVPILEDTCIEIIGTKLVFKEKTGRDDDIPTKQDVIENIAPQPVKPKKVTRHIVRKSSLEDDIIQILAFTRKSTMTCTDITKRLVVDKEDADRIFKILNNSTMIGCVNRLGKTADGSPKENLYYYKPDMDPNPDRRKKYLDTGKSARKCTMKDTQYFFKIPPKLPTHKTRIQTNNKKKLIRNKLLQEDEELKSHSSSDDDVSDMEVFELFKDVE